MEFTLVSTVYNEINRLDDTLRDLRLQTLPPAEIIITDAGSKDGTYEKLLEWKRQSAIPVVILQKKGCNVAEGRNMAIRAAKHNLIASTDFGCRFHPKWLESLIRPFQDRNIRAVAGGYGIVEADIRTTAARAAYLIYNGYQPDFTDFIPSSRSVAYYRELFDAVGGYCEWLTLAADDTLFGMLAKEKGYTFFTVKEPYVYWGRHPTATGYAREFFRYGLGDGEARINGGNAVRIFTGTVLRYTGMLLLPILLLAIGLADVPALYLLLLLPCLYGFKTYLSYTRSWLKLRSGKYNLKVYLFGLYLLERTKINYLKGYYKGYYQSPDYRKTAATELHARFPVLHKA